MVDLDATVRTDQLRSACQSIFCSATASPDVKTLATTDELQILLEAVSSDADGSLQEIVEQEQYFAKFDRLRAIYEARSSN